MVAVDEVFLFGQVGQKQEKNKSSKFNKTMQKQAKEMKQMKWIATLTYNYITIWEIPSIAPGSQVSVKFSTAITVSFTPPSGKQFLWKNANLTRNPYIFSPSICRKRIPDKSLFQVAESMFEETKRL